MNRRRMFAYIGVSAWLVTELVNAGSFSMEGKGIHVCAGALCAESKGDMDLKLEGSNPFVLEITREKVNRISPFKRAWPDVCHYEIIFPKQWTIFSESPGNIWQSVVSDARSNFIRGLNIGPAREYYVNNVMAESYVHSYLYQNSSSSYRTDSLEAKAVIRELIPSYSYVHLTGPCPNPVPGSVVRIYLPKENAYPSREARYAGRPNLSNFSPLEFPIEVVKSFTDK